MVASTPFWYGKYVRTFASSTVEYSESPFQKPLKLYFKDFLKILTRIDWERFYASQSIHLTFQSRNLSKIHIPLIILVKSFLYQVFQEFGQPKLRSSGFQCSGNANEREPCRLPIRHNGWQTFNAYTFRSYSGTKDEHTKFRFKISVKTYFAFGSNFSPARITFFF